MNIKIQKNKEILHRDIDDGSVAIEFAMVGGALFLTTVAFLQLALTLWTHQQLDNGIFRLQRSIATGQINTIDWASDGDTYNKMKAAICSEPLISCSNLYLDLRKLDRYDTDQNNYRDVYDYTIEISEPGAIMRLKASYKLPNAIRPLVSEKFADDLFIHSTAVFTNEPY